MQMNWKKWKHVTKIDPDRENPPELIKEVVESGTDAIMISGTQGITREKILSLLNELEDVEIDVVLEPSHPDAVVEGIPLFIPSVLNSSDPLWILGHHVSWVMKGKVNWKEVVPEAYIVLNPDSAVGRVTKARTELKKDEVCAYAEVAENYFKFPVVYIEYSGRFGDPEVVRAVRERLKNATLFYGGGIDSAEKSRIMSECADVIVVGNVLYEKGLKAYRETILK
ncbi:MAG: phosphoglycerol geranylgeranyltransferase [Archaeoglobi archaeon]|nr:heptaprenylglyceryl phosphate synthase [Candidatus Mnemosynella bozhongmuii]MDK2781150.1 phosphoglycerol geranylgeranyltransferase [Archaeoglobi archaeon]